MWVRTLSRCEARGATGNAAVLSTNTVETLGRTVIALCDKGAGRQIEASRLRLIFGLKVKSKLSSALLASRKPACLRRRSSRRSPRRVSSSETRHEIRSIGAHRLGLGLV